MVKTKKDIKREWYIVDAKGQILGRLATKVASTLYGKGKKNFMPNIDMGDYVVLINAKDVKVTGRKMENKIYWRHTGYPGGIRKKTLKEILRTKPEEAVKKAVKGMLPKNKIAREAFKRLRVFAGESHNIKKEMKELKL